MAAILGVLELALKGRKAECAGQRVERDLDEVCGGFPPD
jgi:hypothetical protein